MRKLIVFAAFIAILGMPLHAFVHGGTYNPPPPNPPPPGPPPPPHNGPPPGPPTMPGDITPPATTPGGGPKAPGATSPGGTGAPAGPSKPKTPGPTAPGAPGGGSGTKPSGPRTAGASVDSADMTQWQYWWAVNQAPYLNLKSHIHAAGGLVTSADDQLGKSRVNARPSLQVSLETIRGVIVPALLAALKSETSDDIQSSCMIALAKIGDPEAPPGGSGFAREVRFEIARRLNSSDQELSETAAVALGILGSSENIGLLTAVLENDLPRLRSLGVAQIDSVDVRTRAFAAYGLGLIGHQSGVYERLVINETLRKLLEGEGRSMAHRDVPVACITAIGLSALPIDDRDAEPSKESKQVGVMNSRQDQLRFLLAFYANAAHNSLTRAQVPTAMGRLLHGVDRMAEFPLRVTVARTLMKSISEHSTDDGAMQQSCILALGMIGDCDDDSLDRSIRTALMRVEETLADQQARRFALIALAQAAGNPGQGMGDPIHGVNTRESKENARSYLLSELNSERGPIRPWVGLALAVLERSLDDSRQTSSSDAKLALRACLSDARSPDELGAFSIACGMVKDIGSAEVLLEHLDKVRDVEARGFAAVGLGLLQQQSALAPLRDLARRSKFQAELIRSAAIALGLLEDKQLVPELIEMLSRANGLSSQAAISRALGTIGDSRSVDSLLGLLRNDQVTELARAFGAVALGIVADKEALPWNAKIGVGSNYRANTSSLTDGKGGILDIL